MATFRYDPEILAAFPDIVGGVMQLRGGCSGPSSDALKSAFHEEQQGAMARIGATPLSQIESLAAWRAAFRRFGVDPTQYRSAAESLLRRVTKKGDVPSMHTLVDIANLISIRYAVPVAVFDACALTLPITVRFSDGTETFADLGSGATQHPDRGEVILSDDTRRVIARRWCWRQSEDSAAREHTTDAIVIIEAHHANARNDVDAALHDLGALVECYVGGIATAAVLGHDRAAL